MLTRLVTLNRIPCKTHNRLRTLRSERGMTLLQVSKATGLAISTLHSLEKGEREPTLATAFKLALFFGLPVEEVWQPLFQRICRKAD